MLKELSVVVEEVRRLPSAVSKEAVKIHPCPYSTNSVLLLLVVYYLFLELVLAVAFKSREHFYYLARP